MYGWMVIIIDAGRARGRLSCIEAVQQFKNGQKRKDGRALNPKRSEFFGVKSNCGTASLVQGRIEINYITKRCTYTRKEISIDYFSATAKRAKGILESENLNVLSDKGYYDALEIKECVDKGIIPYIPKPAPTISRKINVPEPPFYGDKFVYDKVRDIYICPAGHEMSFRNWGKHHGKMMKRYKTDRCEHCEFK